jgi:hypothetical protein
MRCSFIRRQCRDLGAQSGKCSVNRFDALLSLALCHWKQVHP